MANSQRIGALFFLDLLLILAFAGLNAEMAAVAAVGSGTIYTLLALLFPYIMIVLIVVLSGVLISEAIK